MSNHFSVYERVHFGCDVGVYVKMSVVYYEDGASRHTIGKETEVRASGEHA
jgi:hypothetical protein